MLADLENGHFLFNTFYIEIITSNFWSGLYFDRTHQPKWECTDTHETTTLTPSLCMHDEG